MDIAFNTCSLVRITVCEVAFHFGVYPHEDSVYKTRKGREEVVDYDYWLWGRATEMYDHSLEYFGLGPFLFVVWMP
jgi:hypothetical protein